MDYNTLLLEALRKARRPRPTNAMVQAALNTQRAQAASMAVEQDVPNAVPGMQPGMDRLNLLPRYDQQYGVIAPNLLYQMARAGVSPGVAARGGYVSPEDAVNFGANMSLGSYGASKALPIQGEGRTIGMSVDPGEIPKAPAALGDYPTTSPQRIINATTKQGGYSVNVGTGKTPEPGLMVGKYANTDERNTVIGAGQKLTRADVEAHAAKNAKALMPEDQFFGTWRDPDTGTVYFDVSKWFPGSEIRKATKTGERTGQIAGFNTATGKSFPIGNWEEFIKSPEFHQRMNEMEKVGRDYLDNHANKEWWDMHGSAFERVYGHESLDRLAGFIASTAPTRAPRENLQIASEYMRRYIKGEPVVQPDWRVPEGTMSRQPGKQIGNEQTSANNLNKSAVGDLKGLQKDKVNEEARALMGDPNAVVLDRHQARLSEDPARGIYADVSEGTLPAGVPYQKLKDQFLIAAQRAGRSARDYSADVWTGIRETIKTKSDLYGTKYRGSAITGDSKSYADHFEDLVRQKAAHLKISPQELEKRLRSGDAELLSIMLATPLGAAVYRDYVASQQELGT